MTPDCTSPDVVGDVVMFSVRFSTFVGFSSVAGNSVIVGFVVILSVRFEVVSGLVGNFVTVVIISSEGVGWLVFTTLEVGPPATPEIKYEIK